MEISFCPGFLGSFIFLICQETFPTNLHWCHTLFALFFKGYQMPLATCLVLTDPVLLLHPQLDNGIQAFFVFWPGWTGL